MFARSLSGSRPACSTVRCVPPCSPQTGPRELSWALVASHPFPVHEFHPNSRRPSGGRGYLGPPTVPSPGVVQASCHNACLWCFLGKQCSQYPKLVPGLSPRVFIRRDLSSMTTARLGRADPVRYSRCSQRANASYPVSGCTRNRSRQMPSVFLNRCTSRVQPWAALTSSSCMRLGHEYPFWTPRLFAPPPVHPQEDRTAKSLLTDAI